MQSNINADIERMIKSRTSKSLDDAQQYLSEANVKIYELIWAWNSIGDDLDNAIRILLNEPGFNELAMRLQDVRKDIAIREQIENVRSEVINANMKVKMKDPHW